MTGKWNKAGLAEFRAGLSPGRQEEDARKLSKLFNAAAKSPELKDALDWADAHGIEFIVDRGMGSAGVYHSGTGILAVSDQLFEPGMKGEAVATLAHEIRHAWQDWHGLLPTHPDTFTGYYIRQTLMEADAEAHGALAYRQWEMRELLDAVEHGQTRLSRQETRFLREDIEYADRNPAELLWEGFVDWYRSDAPEAYGLITTKGMAESIGLPGTEKLAEENVHVADSDKPLEFDPSLYLAEPPPNFGLDIAGRSSLAPLGQGFRDAGNYFDQAPGGFIESNILSPGLAARFYNAQSRPHPLVLGILEQERKWEEEDRRASGNFFRPKQGAPRAFTG